MHVKVNSVYASQRAPLTTTVITQLSPDVSHEQLRPVCSLFSFHRLLPEDIDAWVVQHTTSLQGVATVFSYSSSDSSTDPGESTRNLHLTRSSGQPCSYSNPFKNKEEKEQQEGENLDVMVQVYPDMSYCRVPRSIKEAVEAPGVNTLMFEAGSVLR